MLEFLDNCLKTNKTIDVKTNERECGVTTSGKICSYDSNGVVIVDSTKMIAIPFRHIISISIKK